jgi:hypothetical protein
MALLLTGWVKRLIVSKDLVGGHLYVTVAVVMRCACARRVRGSLIGLSRRVFCIL